jgi:hypothetical protein
MASSNNPIKYHKVIVRNEGRFVPIIRRPGPILSPVSINEHELDLLVKTGFDVVVLETFTPYSNEEVKVEVKSTLAPLPTPKPLVLPEETIPVVTEAPTEIPTEEVTEAPVTERIDLLNTVVITDSGEIDLHALTLDEYKTYTKDQLVEFFNKIKPALPEEIFPVEKKSKDALIKLIQEAILPD